MASYLDVVIAQFVDKAKRERIAFLAGKPARRADLIDALLHDRRSLLKARMTPCAGATVDHILATLRATPTTTAHVISDIDKLDDRELPLRDALAAIVGRSRDSLVICTTAPRAYYENHEGEQYTLA